MYVNAFCFDVLANRLASISSPILRIDWANRVPPSALRLWVRCGAEMPRGPGMEEGLGEGAGVEKVVSKVSIDAEVSSLSVL